MIPWKRWAKIRRADDRIEMMDREIAHARTTIRFLQLQYRLKRMTGKNQDEYERMLARYADIERLALILYPDRVSKTLKELLGGWK